MKYIKSLSVVHLWSDYYVKADGNPQHYLKQHGIPSNIITAILIADNSAADDNVFYNQLQSPADKADNTLLKRIFKRLLLPFKWFTVNRWAYKKIQEIKPSVLHIHFGYNAVRFLPAIKKSDLPVVLTFYGVDASTMIADPSWRQQYNKAFKYVSAFIVLSAIVKDRIAELGVDRSKITVWNIPIKLNVFQFRVKPRGTVFKFITAARFVEKKGYKFLIDAFDKVYAQNKNCTLTIIGYGPAKAKILAEVERYGLEDVITVVDTNLRTDFHTFYYKQLCEHDVYVLPSTTSKDGDDEGGPALTLVAAQAAGLPVICTPFVGSEITVFDQQTGFICQQDNPDSIAEKMNILIKDEALSNKIGKAASELVNSIFVEEVQMAKVVDIYHGVMAKVLPLL